MSTPAPERPRIRVVLERAREDPIKVASAGDLATAGEQVETEPSEAQKEAGNYRKGHVKVQGLDITIETPKGAERSGTAPDGTPWSVTMPDAYGYVKRTEGADGEQVDVYVGPEPRAETVFVVDQVDADTHRFDEHKVMLGFGSQEEAEAGYEAGFSDGRGRDRMGAVTAMTMDEFKDWLSDGDTTVAAADHAGGGPVDFGRAIEAGDVDGVLAALRALQANGDGDTSAVIDAALERSGRKRLRRVVARMRSRPLRPEAQAAFREALAAGGRRATQG